MTNDNKSLLAKADELINGERAKDYGPVTKSFADIATMWSVILGITVTPTQVILLMQALKICRAKNGTNGHYDSMLDIAGYSGCWDKIKKGE